MKQQNQFIKSLLSPETQEVAFKKLLADYKERLYWHIRKIVINHEDADDVLQNTFIKVFENVSKFKGNSNIYTWMYKIATHESLNLLSKKSRKLGISNEEWIEKQADQLESDAYFEGRCNAVEITKSNSHSAGKTTLGF